MLCTLCRQRLKTKDSTIIHRTLTAQQKDKPQTTNVQWARLPIHDACIDKLEPEMAKNRILMAAGHPYFEYAKDLPSKVRTVKQVNEDGQYQVMVSDRVYKIEDV